MRSCAEIHDRERAADYDRSDLSKQNNQCAASANAVRSERGDNRTGRTKQESESIQSQEKVGAHEFGYPFKLVACIRGRKHQSPFYLVNGKRGSQSLHPSSLD
jgi:hypothetical protein